MDSAASHQLWNQDGGALERVLRGESLVVNHDGRHDAQIASVLSDPLAAETLLERWRKRPTGRPGIAESRSLWISVRQPCDVPSTKRQSEEPKPISVRRPIRSV